MISFSSMMAESQIQKTKLEKLPDEILFKIFSYLTAYDVLKNIRFVCKRFYRITTDEFLIENLEIDKNNELHILPVIGHLKGLKRLIIHPKP